MLVNTPCLSGALEPIQFELRAVHCLQPRIRTIMHAGPQLTSSLVCCVQFLHQFVGLAGAEPAAVSEPNACFNYIMQVYGLQVDSQASILGLPWGLSPDSVTFRDQSIDNSHYPIDCETQAFHCTNQQDCATTNVACLSRSLYAFLLPCCCQQCTCTRIHASSNVQQPCIRLSMKISMMKPHCKVQILFPGLIDS